MLIFAMASPLGVALGIVLSMENSKLIEASFTALACGSFLYVGANEVVSEEFEPQAYRQSKFACLVFGIALIIALTTLEAD
jgi:zinc transporter 1/2/3